MNTKSSMSQKSLEFLEKITGKKVTFSNTLWAIRECEELSQSEMAKQLGVSRQYLCDIEHGRRAVSPSMAANFAIKLGYLPAHFIQLAMQDELNKAGLSFDVTINHHRDAA